MNENTVDSETRPAPSAAPKRTRKLRAKPLGMEVLQHQFT